MGRLQANSNLSKDNKISIKKQNLGGGELITRKIIPYSTYQIILSGFNNINVNVNRTSPITLTKRTVFGYPNEWGADAGTYQVYLYRSDSNGTWSIILQQFGEEGFGTVTCATNPSTSNIEIPTTGWVLENGVIGTITIIIA